MNLSGLEGLSLARVEGSPAVPSVPSISPSGVAKIIYKIKQIILADTIVQSNKKL